MLTPTPTQLFADQAADTLARAPEAPPRARPSGQGYTLVGAVVAVVIGLVLSGAGAEGPAGLLVRTADGITVLDGEGAPVWSAFGGLVSPDGTVVAHAERMGPRRTRVIASDSATGALRWSAHVRGAYEVRLVAEGGDAAVLGRPMEEGVSPYVPEGRARTRLVVATRSGAREYELAGNFEPEALSLDASSLFVIQYLPALAPESYQVRRLDLATGAVGDVFTPDEELQQEMGGTARTQVASSDGRRLYTLYTLGSGDGAVGKERGATADAPAGRAAFVHVLDLDEEWAHCIDLPKEFTGAGESTALALSPDGAALHVADRAAGAVTAVDTETLEVIRTERLWRDPAGQVAATATASGELLVATGARIDVLDPATLLPVRSLAVAQPVVAMHDQGGDRLAVALTNKVVWVDPGSGAVLDARSWGEGPQITGLGATAGTMSVPQGIDCAC